MDLTRKEFLRMTVGGAALMAAGGPRLIADAFAAEAPILTRKVAKTGEVLPLVGLGKFARYAFILWAVQAI